VRPSAFTDVLRWVRARYGDRPIFITENGAAFRDPPPDEGRIQDGARIGYLRTHLCAVRDAIAAGVDVRGYYLWSLLDNLEWAHGFSKRFGIVAVNYANQRRIPKESARFYSQVIASNGAAL
jgi:beta-glucosidase